MIAEIRHEIKISPLGFSMNQFFHKLSDQPFQPIDTLYGQCLEGVALFQVEFRQRLQDFFEGMDDWIDFQKTTQDNNMI